MNNFENVGGDVMTACCMATLMSTSISMNMNV